MGGDATPLAHCTDCGFHVPGIWFMLFMFCYLPARVPALVHPYNGAQATEPSIMPTPASTSPSHLVSSRLPPQIKLADGVAVDQAWECTGVFLTRAAIAPHFDALGANKVVVSAPVKDTPAVLNVVVGCNDVSGCCGGCGGGGGTRRRRLAGGGLGEGQERDREVTSITCYILACGGWVSL